MLMSTIARLRFHRIIGTSSASRIFNGSVPRNGYQNRESEWAVKGDCKRSKKSWVL